MKSEYQRFQEKYVPEPNSGCWLWIGGVSGDGYGQFWYKKRVTPAHRVAYELYVGEIPKGLPLDHLCRTHACVNPKHLEPVTHQVNCLRGVGSAAKNAQKTHCIYGHIFSTENTYRHKGRRQCRICNDKRDKKRRPKRRLNQMLAKIKK